MSNEYSNQSTVNAISAIPPNRRIDNQYERRRVERKIYPTKYFTGADCYLLATSASSTRIFDVVSYEFAIVEPVVSLYSYYDYARTGKAFGQRLVKGTMAINLTTPGLLINIAGVPYQDNLTPAAKSAVDNRQKEYEAEAKEDTGAIFDQLFGGMAGKFLEMGIGEENLDMLRTYQKQAQDYKVKVMSSEIDAITQVSREMRPNLNLISKLGKINKTYSVDYTLVYITASEERQYYRLVDVDFQLLQHAVDMSGRASVEIYQFVATDVDFNCISHYSDEDVDTNIPSGSNDAGIVNPNTTTKKTPFSGSEQLFNGFTDAQKQEIYDNSGKFVMSNKYIVLYKGNEFRIYNPFFVPSAEDIAAGWK